MNTQHTPSADELLHAYIDGDLPAEHEQQFYSLLSVDSEYRLRLRQLRAIRAEALKYGAHASAPAAITAKLFDRLGLESREKRRSGVFILPLITNAWAPIASAAAAAFITAVILLGMQQSTLQDSGTRLASTSPPSQQLVGEPDRGAHELTPPVTDDVSRATLNRSASNETAVASLDTEIQQNTEAPLETSHESDNPARPALASEASREIADLLHESTASHGTTEQTQTSTAQLADNSFAAESPNQDDVSFVEAPYLLNAQQSMARLQEGRIYYPVNEARLGNGLVTLEFRGVTASSFPRATVASDSTTPWMENMAVSVFLSGDQTDYGLEFGQEAFSQHYNGIEQGKRVRYEQNLRSSWLVATLRHRLSPLQALGGIEPYATLSAGGTFEIWPLFKGGLGIMCMPDRRVRFHVGIEGALLAYPYQGTWFTSKRAGVTYGLSVLF